MSNYPPSSYDEAAAADQMNNNAFDGWYNHQIQLASTTNQQQQHASHQQRQHRQHVAAASQQLPPLPQGWEEMRDPQSGRVYYIDHAQQLTQWNRPTISDSIVVGVGGGSSSGTTTALKNNLENDRTQQQGKNQVTDILDRAANNLHKYESINNSDVNNNKNTVDESQQKNKIQVPKDNEGGKEENGRGGEGKNTAMPALPTPVADGSYEHHTRHQRDTQEEEKTDLQQQESKVVPQVKNSRTRQFTEKWDKCIEGESYRYLTPVVNFDTSLEQSVNYFC